MTVTWAGRDTRNGPSIRHALRLKNVVQKNCPRTQLAHLSSQSCPSFFWFSGFVTAWIFCNVKAARRALNGTLTRPLVTLALPGCVGIQIEWPCLSCRFPPCLNRTHTHSCRAWGLKSELKELSWQMLWMVFVRNCSRTSDTFFPILKFLFLKGVNWYLAYKYIAPIHPGPKHTITMNMSQNPDQNARSVVKMFQILGCVSLLVQEVFTNTV